MLKIIYLASATFIFASCAAQSNTGENKSNTPSAQNETPANGGQICQAILAKDFKAGIAAGNVQILDVRTPQETAQGKIDGAIEINFYDNDFKSRVSQLDRDIPVYVYCRSGGRSSQASEVLKELGFAVIYDLKGGFMNY
jgi:rhodanese-related sulfurtransferase